jgi:hypothetical protein
MVNPFSLLVASAAILGYKNDFALIFHPPPAFTLEELLSEKKPRQRALLPVAERSMDRVTKNAPAKAMRASLAKSM